LSDGTDADAGNGPYYLANTKVSLNTPRIYAGYQLTYDVELRNYENQRINYYEDASKIDIKALSASN